MQKYIEKKIGDETYLVKSPEWIAEQNKILTERRIRLSNLPIHVTDLSLKSYISEDRTIPRKLDLYVSEFDNKFKNIHLYFWSHENGTQKTTMAGIVAKLLLDKGKKVCFVSMGDLLKNLQSEQFDEEAASVVCLYKSCDFLIVDDSFDKRKATMYKSGWQVSFLDQFLRYRLETVRLATCFTSNFAVDEIDESVFGIGVKKLVQRSIPDPFHFDVLYQQRNHFNPNDLWS